MGENGTGIELDILNPEQFQTLEKIRDFVTGEGAEALRYAIGEALQPWAHTGEIDEVENGLKDELIDAREGALFVNNDLQKLARAAVESEGDPVVFTNTGLILDRDRRALLFIALRESDACDSAKLGVVEYLGGAGDRCRKALLEVVETGRSRAAEILEEHGEIAERIKSLEAERAKLGDEWDEILRRDSGICAETNAAANA